MNYITFTQQFHTGSRELRKALKQQYPHYYSNMMNRAWAKIAEIRARKTFTEKVAEQKQAV